MTELKMNDQSLCLGREKVGKKVCGLMHQLQFWRSPCAVEIGVFPHVTYIFSNSTEMCNSGESRKVCSAAGTL